MILRSFDLMRRVADLFCELRRTLFVQVVGDSFLPEAILHCLRTPYSVDESHSTSVPSMVCSQVRVTRLGPTILTLFPF